MHLKAEKLSIPAGQTKSFKFAPGGTSMLNLSAWLNSGGRAVTLTWTVTINGVEIDTGTIANVPAFERVYHEPALLPPSDGIPSARGSKVFDVMAPYEINLALQNTGAAEAVVSCVAVGQAIPVHV